MSESTHTVSTPQAEFHAQAGTVIPWYQTSTPEQHAQLWMGVWSFQGSNAMQSYSPSERLRLKRVAAWLRAGRDRPRAEINLGNWRAFLARRKATGRA
jgi:hypothetical protein